MTTFMRIPFFLRQRLVRFGRRQPATRIKRLSQGRIEQQGRRELTASEHLVLSGEVAAAVSDRIADDRLLLAAFANGAAFRHANDGFGASCEEDQWLYNTHPVF